MRAPASGCDRPVLECLDALQAAIEAETSWAMLRNHIHAIRDILDRAYARLESLVGHGAGVNESRPAPEKRDGDQRRDGSDRLLSAAAAAQMLGTSPKWLYRHQDELPFTRRLSPRALRFSEAGLRRWLERQRGCP